MTSATEVLRRLLDERGVEWDGESYESVTFWNEETNMAVASDNNDGLLWVSQRLTPEQAIAATLGTGTCHVESSIIDTYEYNRWEYELSCGHTIIWEDSEPPNYCPNCGRKVVDA